MTHPEITKCKKCGKPHVIEEWRKVKFVVCPKVGRVLLVNTEHNNVRHDRRTGSGTSTESA